MKRMVQLLLISRNKGRQKVSARRKKPSGTQEGFGAPIIKALVDEHARFWWRLSTWEDLLVVTLAETFPSSAGTWFGLECKVLLIDCKRAQQMKKRGLTDTASRRTHFLGNRIS
jgi:hypothetical protein